MDYYFGSDGFGEAQKDYTRSVEDIGGKHLESKSACEFMVEAARQHPHQVTIICLGALTNIAAAIQIDP